MRSIALTTATALGLALSATAAHAAAITPLAPGEAQETISPEIILGDIVKDGRLKAIAELLRNRKHEEARPALAQFLRENPRDARALELGGMLFMQEGSYKLAEETLTTAIVNEPLRASAIAKLGVVLLLEGNSKGAEVALNKAIEIRPAEPLALRYLAYLEQTRQRPFAVIYYLERLMQTGWVRSDRITEAHMTLAQAYRLAGRDEAIRTLLEPLILERAVVDPGAQGAITLLESELRLGNATQAGKLVDALRERLGEGDYRVRVGAASVKRLARDYDGSTKDLTALLAADPGRAADIHYQIALTRRDNKDWQGATRELEAAAAAANENQIVPILNELAAALASTGQGARAIEVLRSYGQKYPDVPSISYMTAEIKTQQGDLAGARTILTDITKKHDRYPAALYLLGLVEWKMGRVEPARRAVRQMVDANPKDIKGWLTLVGMYDDKKAATTKSPMYAVLEEGLKANPNHPDLLYEKATVLYSAGDVAGAEATYRQILSQVPDHVPALNNLASSIIDNSKDPTEAKPFIERARARAPNDPSVLDTYAWLMLRTGDRANAVKILEQVAKASPKDATVQYHLGVAYLESQKADEGRAKLKQALGLGLPRADAAKARALVEAAPAR